MFITVISVLILLIDGNVYARSEAECNNSELDDFMTLTPSTDGVIARYILRWCTTTFPNVTTWQLQLKYVKDGRGPDKCIHYDLYTIHPLEILHSRFSEPLQLNLNCTKICFSRTLDLLFTACYSIKTNLRIRNRSFQVHDYLLYVSNQFHSAQDYNYTKTYVRTRSYGKEIYAHWFLGYIPLVEFTMDMCRINNNSDHYEECMDISRNCSIGVSNDLECSVVAPFACYALHLSHRAPWTHGSILPSHLKNVFWEYCHYDDEAPLVITVKNGRGGAILIAVGVGMAVAALLAAVAVRCHLTAAFRRRVLNEWLARYDDLGAGAARGAGGASGAVDEGAVGGAEGADSEHVVLIYARDCAPAMRAFALLGDIIRQATRLPVYDLYSPACVSLGAGAGAEWVRAAVRGRRARTLVLQTPAAAALHCTTAAPDMTLERPLLGSAVAPASPAPGDALVGFALRLLAESAHREHVCSNYFIAEFTDLPAEMLPQVTPFKRYELPGATELLLRDLSPAAVNIDDTLRTKLAEFATAVEEYVEFVRQNENYLQDHFVFM